jgi:outer membrane protein assembly factor BamB
MHQRCPSPIRNALLALFLLACSSTIFLALAQPQTALNQTAPRAHLQWTGKPGVKRYRLQVAHDRRFKDIVFDRIVMGNDYQLTELPRGSYFWRVAPAVGETGRYSPPQQMQVQEPTVETATVTAMPTPTPTPRTTPRVMPTPVRTPQPTPTPVRRATLIMPPANSGWRTVTGEIMQPVAAHLRNAESFDLAGVNADGMVYVLDGGTGVSLWSARYRPGARRGEPTGSGGGIPPFNPLPLKTANGLANLLVAYDGGVRALSGTNGRELWRSPLPGRALSGAVSQDEGNAIYIVTGSDDDSSLLVLDGATGKIESNRKLDGALIGAPVPFNIKETRGVMLALKGGVLDMRDQNGERMRSIKMDTAITTPPLIVEGGPYGALLLIGTEKSLISLDATELRPLGQIATEDDSPRGLLSATDLNGDGKTEVVMLTRKGVIVVIGSDDGRIKWYTKGATDAASAAFADLNQDGTLDVLVAAGSTFALGFSGRDGALIWRAEEPGATSAGQATGNLRSLVTAPLAGGSIAYLVGSDSSHTTLRAVGLPNGSVKVAGR